MIVDQFDEMLEQSEKQPLVFSLSLHGFILGQPFRLRPLRQAIKHCVQHKNADQIWFTRAGEISKYCSAWSLGSSPAAEDCHEYQHNSRRDHQASQGDARDRALGLSRRNHQAGAHDQFGRAGAIECATCNPEWMPAKDSGFDILPDIVEIHQKVKKGSGNHIFTGPIYMRDAAVGDVLEVKILDIELRQNWGWNLFRGYMGTIPEDFPYMRIIHVPLDLKANVATMASGFKIPLAPFFGQLAVAPAAVFGRQNSKEPREFGGNLDCKELTAGSTIYLPVWNEGALFSTGDGHAAQGDGEVDGTAIETALAGTFEFM